MDHKWSAGTQTARIYAAGVEEAENVQPAGPAVLYAQDRADSFHYHRH